MKPLKFMAVLFCLLASANRVCADNYLSLRTDLTNPVNDTLRISPQFVATYCPMYVTANFDGYLDHWYVQFTYPDTNPFDHESNGSDLTLPYTRIDGTDTIFTPILTTNIFNIPAGTGLLSSAYSATSTVYGYWDSDSDGVYEQYGTVKWENGFYNDMFEFLLYIPSDSVKATIVISYTLSSTSDSRPVPLIDNGTYQKTLHLKIAYLLGDTDGNNTLSLADVTTLIDWMLNGTDLTVYQFNAGDVNCDGRLSIADVSALLDLLNEQNQMIPDLSELETLLQ